jgi:preprotein translocase subunit YajC
MMYFVLIRPQRQRQKAHEELVKNVKTGDHIVTAGGVHGIVASVKDTTLMLRVADNVRVEYDRSAVATVKKKTEGDASASIADKS